MTNPFDNGYNQKDKWSKAVTPILPENQEFKLNNPVEGEEIKNFPRHLFPPRGAQTVDLLNLEVIPAGTTLYRILTFQCPLGMQVIFTGFAVFNDGLDFTKLEFVPKINGSRILRYQGYPYPNGYCKIALGLGPDLGNNSLRYCQVPMNPRETLTWDVTNTDLVDVVMGVRMTGYASTGNIRTNEQFGG